MNNLIIISLEKDEELFAAIKQYLKNQTWEKAIIIAASGSLYNVTVSNPITFNFPPVLLPITINEPCEVVSLSGEIIANNEADCGYKLHIHGAISHGSGVVSGGSIKGGIIYSKLYIYALII